MTSRPVLRTGIGGLGVGATAMIGDVAVHPNVKIVAGADPRPAARERFEAEFGATTYESVEAMCESPDIDLVYIMTPSRMHARQAVIAADRGKQVVLDKPMGLSLEECDAVVAAAERNQVRVLVGHTQSLDPPILRMAEIARSGNLGRPIMANTWFYSDWLYRPRSAEELDPRNGDGLVMRQGPVQVDIVRMLLGGRARSVRAAVTALDPARPIEGSYSAFLDFQDGPAATLVYSAYAHFATTELTWGIGLRGRADGPDTNLSSRRQIAGFSPPEAEYAHKDAGRYGGSRAGTAVSGGDAHAFFGVTVLSCERGDIRQTPEGVLIYGDDTRWEERVSGGDQYHRRYTAIELDIMYDAWSKDAPLRLHNAAWARGTTEVCLGIQQSGREHRDVALKHQVPYQGAEGFI